MAIVTRRRDLALGAAWPVLSNLHFLGFADNPNNTFFDPTRMNLMADESGNGRDATTPSSGEIYEAAGSSEGKPCIRAAGTRFQYNGGTALSSSKLSVFAVTQSDTQQTATGNTSGGEVGLTWTADNNSPLIRNNVNGNIVVGSAPQAYHTAYNDQVSRSWCFAYDDAGNVRNMSVSGVLTNDNSDWGGGTAAGTIDIARIMGVTEVGNNRLLVLAVYEAKVLNSTEISDLHGHVKDTLGLVA